MIRQANPPRQLRGWAQASLLIILIVAGNWALINIALPAIRALILFAAQQLGRWPI